MDTLEHTSVKILAVRSLMSLCRIEGRLPQEQLRACSTEKSTPQTQWEGIWEGCQPYRIQSASWKQPLCRAKLCSIFLISRASWWMPVPYRCHGNTSCHSLLPALTGRTGLNNMERSLIKLPARLGGLRIMNPTKCATVYHNNSANNTPLIFQWMDWSGSRKSLMSGWVLIR